MLTEFVETEILYDGTQLRSHFAYHTAGLQGDSIVSFIGGADVQGDHLVDLEDRKSGLFIYSPKMLHFIIEHFKSDLELAITRQRLFMALVCEAINETKTSSGVIRNGDDLYVDNRKLSVSIATCSPVSTLIHAGLNIETANTPVPASGLRELGINPRQLADAVMNRYVDEIAGMKTARWKVRYVQ